MHPKRKPEGRCNKCGCPVPKQRKYCDKCYQEERSNIHQKTSQTLIKYYDKIGRKSISRKYKRKCINCDNDAIRHKRYCPDCYNEKNKERIQKQNKKAELYYQKLSQYNGEAGKCLFCGQETKSMRLFCSERCAKTHLTQTIRSEWENRVKKDGFYYDREYTGSSSIVRKYIIRQHGNNCMVCGQSGENWQGKPITLIVDHIDGDAHNWAIENIQLVCPNCDSQLPTFKGRNVGKSTRKYTITQK